MARKWKVTIKDAGGDVAEYWLHDDNAIEWTIGPPAVDLGTLKDMTESPWSCSQFLDRAGWTGLEITPAP